MILDQAIKEVQQIAGWRGDKVVEITAALQYMQDELEKPGLSYPWWLRKEDPLSVVTSANVPKYNLPSDFIQDTEETDGNLFIYTIAGQINSRTIFLKKMSFETAQLRYYGEWPYIYTNPPGAIQDQSATVSPGVPIDYYEGDTFLILYPVPDNVYNISRRYWAKDATQAIGQENKWLKNAPWVLIGGTALKICGDLGNADGVARATQILQTAQANMFRSVVAREESGRKRSIGSRL